MLCTGEHCERALQCERYYRNAKDDGKIHSVESLYYFGSGGSGIETTWICGPHGSWGKFVERQMTHADQIRAMSDGELAKTLQLGCPPIRIENERCNERKTCTDCWLEWLRQPAEQEEERE